MTLRRMELTLTLQSRVNGAKWTLLLTRLVVALAATRKNGAKGIVATSEGTRVLRGEVLAPRESFGTGTRRVDTRTTPNTRRPQMRRTNGTTQSTTTTLTHNTGAREEVEIEARKTRDVTGVPPLTTRRTTTQKNAGVETVAPEEMNGCAEMNDLRSSVVSLGVLIRVSTTLVELVRTVDVEVAELGLNARTRTSKTTMVPN